MDNGGIDLSRQNENISIEKDSNGGVKVHVDQRLIAQVEREGIKKIIPVIVGMRWALTQSLFEGY
ncbi:MAG: hypothetical protein HQL13_06245 [Candidatus Omnitrophica bacterium]|nr:hypothetical protein [Candidatus Omnitrophota bacterium]